MKVAQNHSYTGHAEDPDAPKEITTQLIEMQKAVGDLLDKVVALTEQLKPVLNDCILDESGNGSGAEKQANTELGGAIQDQRLRVRRALWILNDLSDRLEV